MTVESDFELQLLRDSVCRFVREQYSIEQRRSMRVGANTSGKTSNWQKFAENGWLGAAFDEEYGGSGGGTRQLAAIVEALGRGLVTEPYLPNVLSGWIVERLGTVAQKKRILSPLIHGSIQMSLVWDPMQAPSIQGSDGLTIHHKCGSLILTGRQSVVAGGNADELLVVANVVEAGRDVRKECVIVLADFPGVHRNSYRMVDDSVASDFFFDGVTLPKDAVCDHSGLSEGTLNKAFDLAATLTCCEALGVMTLAFDTTLSHLKQRTQFGRPLGQNQALQHRMVDLHILLCECEALTRQALYELETGEEKSRARAVSAAKAHVNQTARRMGQEAIQMHGGIGTTDEALISHAFKRLMAMRLQYGDTSWHKRRVARCLDYLPFQMDGSPKGQL